MFLSCILAFLFPFQLFLFSFVVLGPLHYFTEIPWLHGKKYYTSGKYDYFILLCFCIIIAVFHFIAAASPEQHSVLAFISGISFMTFFTALILTTLKKTSQKIMTMIALAVSA